MNLRILNAEPEDYSREARQILESIGEVIEDYCTQDTLAKKVSSFDVLIVRLALKVDREVMQASKKLKFILTATTGLDHIELKAAKDLKIKVISLQGEREFLKSVTATAEHTWALLLSLIRRVPWAFNDVLYGNWNRDRFKGNDLRGKNIGILGFGRIGKHIASYSLSFGMKVGAYDPFEKAKYPNVCFFNTVEDLLRWSQILSIHIPLVENNQKFLNEKRLRLLPKGAWLINTARGEVIDEKSLVHLLEEGYLSGAAVDVIVNEREYDFIQNNPLLKYAVKHQNLLITPHLGGATAESMHRTEVFLAKKFKNILKSKF